ncbi:MAG: FMN-binding protein [Firmicutes bacterium]|nr:FMN-binding protein [Bacillota bacterium]
MVLVRRLGKIDKFKKGIIALCCIGALSGGTYLYSYIAELNNYKTIVAGLQINELDLSQVKDGTFRGNCDAIFVAADVSVTVKDHKITEIQLIRHKTERGQTAEMIPAKVIKAQSLQVDTISGATNSSKVILKAIEIAVNSGRQ